MHRIAGRGNETEMLVEGSRLPVFGVDGKGAQARNIGGGERPSQRVFQQTGSDSFARPSTRNREARKDHQRHRMSGYALA